MNTNPIRALIALAILFACGQASAIPVLEQYIVIFSHANGTLGAGLTVDARTTDTSRLVVAGGYTIRCASSPLQYDEVNNSTLSGFTQVRIVVKVPGPPLASPTNYPVPGWSGVTTCTECTMTHKYDARDETSLSVSLGIAKSGINAGANFALLPTGEIGVTSTAVLADVCKRNKPQCCGPGCVIP